MRNRKTNSFATKLRDISNSKWEICGKTAKIIGGQVELRGYKETECLWLKISVKPGKWGSVKYKTSDDLFSTIGKVLRSSS